MEFDNDLVVGKLRRWEKYLAAYRLPAWEQIPDLGLYMEQVVLLLRQYLDYLPPELKQPEPITAAAINNYVRTRLLPEPRKKRYYRAYRLSDHDLHAQAGAPPVRAADAAARRSSGGRGPAHL